MRMQIKAASHRIDQYSDALAKFGFGGTTVEIESMERLYEFIDMIDRPVALSRGQWFGGMWEKDEYPHNILICDSYID